MTGTPYSQRRPDELVLRDQLAVDRTVLANERTLLAYVRTAMAFIVLGVSLLEFFKGTQYIVVGCVSLVLGIGMLAVGGWRFLQVHRRLSRIHGRPASPQKEDVS
ncbi:MAG: DUF202 domain-containing protein [Thermoguttaceae bacterium]|jgi:putative membrane protein|nr:DUF202 domain-containing protein [Thermoguttaceae bacterium]